MRKGERIEEETRRKKNTKENRKEPEKEGRDRKEEGT